MSTLVIVEEVLRECGSPMVVREIVQYAAERLPTKSKTPDTVVARDLAMDIKKHGEESKFTRVAPGKYTLRELVGGEVHVELRHDDPERMSASESAASPEA
jgi:HB1, ASXL, restriction endonuclease HTH domain